MLELLSRCNYRGAAKRCAEDAEALRYSRTVYASFNFLVFFGNFLATPVAIAAFDTA